MLDTPHEQEPQFPCLYMELRPGDRMYEHEINPETGKTIPGARFRVDNIEGEEYYFGNEERSDNFIDDHGFYCVDLDDMDELRMLSGIQLFPNKQSPESPE